MKKGHFCLNLEFSLYNWGRILVTKWLESLNKNYHSWNEMGHCRTKGRKVGPKLPVPFRSIYHLSRYECSHSINNKGRKSSVEDPGMPCGRHLPHWAKEPLLKGNGNHLLPWPLSSMAQWVALLPTVHLHSCW